MRINTLFDQGSAEEKEDGLLYRPPVYGVIDGVSAVYNSEHPIRLFDGKSGGAMVTQNIIDNFSVCRDDLSLEKMIVIANTVVKMVQLEAGVSFENSSQLAGATFAFTKINEKNIEIIQAGDSMALLLLKDGSIIMTPNQVLAHDNEADKMINDIQKKYREEGFDLDKAREKAWIDIYPILTEMKLNDVNNKDSERGYGLLNGQPELNECWFKSKYPVKELELIILFTDGFVPYEEFNKQSLGNQLVDYYKKKRLEGILSMTRDFESQNKEESYTDFREATAIAIEF